jgi:glycosyltransferase involved in cell wall biosynthesis
MRVGIDIGPLTNQRTGVGNYCYYLLKHLLDLDQACHYHGFSSGLSPINLDGLDGRIDHRHLPIPTRILYRLWSTLGRPSVDGLLGGVDLYHATNYFLPPTSQAASVVTIHDLAFIAQPSLCSPRIVGPFSKGIRRFAQRANAILTYSESTKRDVLNFLEVDEAKVAVAPMAVDDGFLPIVREEAEGILKNQFKVEGPFLLFISTLEPRKNVPTLIKAFARIHKKIPHNLLLIGGVGWNADPIFETIEQLGIQDRIIRPGFIPHHMLPAFYSAADAFVFPTLYEGFGLPLLEALTCGCPVIAADNSSVPEVTGDAALLSDAMDEAALAENVLAVLEDDALRAGMIARGKTHAAQYSWGACAEKTLQVYRSVA